MKQINNIKFLVFLIFISVISIVYIFSLPEKSKNTQLPIGQNFPTPITNIKSPNIVFQNIKNYTVYFDQSIDWSIFPKSLTIYSANLINEDINDLAKKIIKEFNLYPSTNNKETWSSVDKQEKFTINYKLQTFNYSFNFQDDLYNKLYSKINAINTANDFVSKVFSESNFELYSDQITYLRPIKNQLEWPLSTEINSSLINIPYGYKINGYNYYIDSNLSNNLSISVGPGNTIYSIQYISQPIPNIIDSISKPLISQNLAKKLFEDGQGQIIGLNFLDIIDNSTTLPPITIKTVKIEYRFDSIKNKIIPFFLFTAEFSSTPQEQTSPIYIILPAVEL